MSKERNRRRSWWAAARLAFRLFRQELRGGTEGTAGTRAYKVAQLDRLTANWPTTPISVNRELRQDLRAIRNRIRILAQNDDFIKKYLSMSASNIAGWNGFKLQLSMSDWIDGEASGEAQKIHDEQILKEVKAAFEEWSHMECASASGKLSWVDQQRLFPRTIKRDGEVLVRKMVGDNAFAFTLKFIDVAWLDETYNMSLPNGNRIIMSVEVDKNDRPVAYWLTMPSSEYLWNAKPPNAPFRQRVPASEFIHAFYVLNDDSQARGEPPAHTAAMSLRVLDDYEYAELTGSYVDACNLPYLVPPKDEEDSYPTDKGTEGEVIPQPVEEQVEPAIQKILPAGWDVKAFTPGHPNANYAAFAKAVLRRAASGLEVAYYSLANDLEGANYSSMKAGQQEERAVWRYDQNFEIEHFNRVVFSGPGLNFLGQAWLVGKINCSPADLKRIRATWGPRGWPSIEPLKEIQATILAINNFLDSHIDDAAERGEEWEDIVTKVARAYKLIEKLGLKPGMPDTKKPVETDDAEDAQENENEEENENPADDTSRVLPNLQIA